MKTKIFLIIVFLGFTAISNGQTIPPYVPTNGLIGWWPLDSNALDESGNGHHGTVYGGATVSNYLSMGYNTLDYVSIPAATLNNLQAFSVCFRIRFNSFNSAGGAATNHIISGDILGYEENFGVAYQKAVGCWRFALGYQLYDFLDSDLQDSTWYCFVLQRDENGVISAYRDNIQLPNSFTNTGATFVTSLLIGQETDCTGGCFSLNQCTNGQIDNLAIYDRALNSYEVNGLCGACALYVNLQPSIYSTNVSGDAQFTAFSSEPDATFQWQTDVAGLGWQNVPNNGVYSGGTTNNLNIYNVQLANHMQQLRVLTTFWDCIDTSEVVEINILDTCLTTITDTNYISVTDTLIIDVITGLPTPNHLNTIKIYPNPGSDHITIDYGNYANISGYTLKITNALGATVFITSINQQSSYIDLSTWNGSGIYYVHLIDSLNNTVDIRKIVIQ
jgi:hypothetical protein